MNIWQTHDTIGFIKELVMFNKIFQYVKYLGMSLDISGNSFDFNIFLVYFHPPITAKIWVFSTILLRNQMLFKENLND